MGHSIRFLLTTDDLQELSEIKRLLEEIRDAVTGRAPIGTLLSVTEVARHLNVSPPTVRKLMKDGKLKKTMVGRRTMVRTEDLDAYLKR